jgi:hypothetical protein
MANLVNKQAVINAVLIQLKKDLNQFDETAIEELLKDVPVQSLIAYLPEPQHEQFNVSEDFVFNVKAKEERIEREYLRCVEFIKRFAQLGYDMFTLKVGGNFIEAGVIAERIRRLGLIVKNYDKRQAVYGPEATTELFCIFENK